MMPAWRIPPPKSLRLRRTSWIRSASPATAEPTGAPRPFEKHTETESTSAATSAGETPSATAAFQSRAPSMCSRMSCSRANAAMSRIRSGATTSPPASPTVFSTEIRLWRA